MNYQSDDHRHTRYVVITPARDEAKYIEKTIQSMVSQTERPVQWIIVDDGSTDGTPAIVEGWTSSHPWISLVHRRSQNPAKQSRGRRAREAKEIEAFYEGYRHVKEDDWEFIVKLDADLGFADDYFERCFAEFRADSILGMGGGVICHWIDGKLQVEKNPHFHVRGATKIYRRQCWEAIGGVVCGAAWDTVDEVKANMLGWSTRSFDHLSLIHYKYTGSANGAWQNAMKNGIWNYVSGYHPLFMFAKSLKRIFEPPYVIQSLGLFWGFLSGYFQRVPQIDDKRVIRYLREQQLRRLSFRTTTWR
jgi:poly-beta-1,6-N-acetyl-D-glucosamine synthase